MRRNNIEEPSACRLPNGIFYNIHDVLLKNRRNTKRIKHYFLPYNLINYLLKDNNHTIHW